VLFVIRREFEAEFRAAVSAKYAGRIAVDFVFQSLDELPEGFACRPAGRSPGEPGHAVWCARAPITRAVRGHQRRRLLRRQRLTRGCRPSSATPGPPTPSWASAWPTRSPRTAPSPAGSARQGGRLESITEEKAIARADVGPGGRFTGHEIVSMNFWGFTPAIFDGLGEGFARSSPRGIDDPKAEFYLPGAVSDLISRGAASVDADPERGRSWFGITYREDRPRGGRGDPGACRKGSLPARLFP
jgi:hypothetical protein